MTNFDQNTPESIMNYSIPKAWLKDAADSRMSTGLKLAPDTVDIKLLKDFYKVNNLITIGSKDVELLSYLNFGMTEDKIVEFYKD